MVDRPGVGGPVRWIDDVGQWRTAGLLAADEIVSQYGRADSSGVINFREVPRFESKIPTEYEISMRRGRCSVREVAEAIRQMPAPERQRKRDRVRWFRVGDLMDKGYLVLATPRPRSPQHVSIYAGIAPDDLHELTVTKQWWDQPERVTLKDLALGIGGEDQ